MTDPSDTSIAHAKEIQEAIERELNDVGIPSIDGLRGPRCQTGEEYVELVVTTSVLANLKIAVRGAVAAFAVPSGRCYWRIKTEVDLPDAGFPPKAYLRFRITEKAEEAAAA